MIADPLLVETVNAVLTDLCSAAAVRDAEDTQVLPARLVAAFEGAGLHQVGVPETSGGAGGSAADAAAVVRGAGRHACPLPVAEQALMAGWLLERAGLELPSSLVTTAVRTELTLVDGRAQGQGSRVPWLGELEDVIALTDDHQVVRLRVSDLDVVPGKNLAGERRDSFRADSVLPLSSGPVPVGTAKELLARAAGTRVLLLAGACETLLRLVVRYASEREQFGKPINTFQAVASHLARMAEETALVSAAADLVALALGDSAAWDEVAVAKSVAGESSSTVARLAHQVHGAMGVTAECDVQLFTRRIWSWRDEHGGEAFWSREVGRRLVAAGPAGAWDLVVAPAGGVA